MSVSSGPFSRRRTSTCRSILLLVRSTKIFVTERTTALLDCFRRLSRMFMISNISPSSATWYLVSSLSTAHCPHSENWLRRLSSWVTISRVGWKPPSSTMTSSIAVIALATTCASVSWMSLFNVTMRSASITACLEMWKTFTAPITAVFRTYPLTSSSAFFTAGRRYSTMFTRLREQRERRASPRIMGSSSTQSFCKVFTARIASSALLSA
mmetsp:Transcript_64197/g.168005  ORF Transcript_64197/g.168005 Transcript_64197/m.168005 type:complete len:211 (-) Transcript_64197:335-967(-)